MKKTIRALSLALVVVLLMPMVVACNPETGDSTHEHEFSKMVVNTKFLKEEGSCSKKSTYYYSCECGEKGTEIFEGEKSAF